MANLGISCSMSRSDNVWDNAAVASFLTSLKTERIGKMVYRTRDDARGAVASARDTSAAVTTARHRLSSDARFSPSVGKAIQHGDIDLGLRRLEPHPDVTYMVLDHEPILVFLSRDHPLSPCSAIDFRDIKPLSFIGYSATAHILRGIVDRYFRDRGIAMSPTRFLDGVANGISLVASTGGVTLLPAYVEKM